MAKRLAPAPPRLTTARKNAAERIDAEMRADPRQADGKLQRRRGRRPGQQLVAGHAQDGEAGDQAHEVDQTADARQSLQSHGHEPRAQQHGHARERHGDRHGLHLPLEQARFSWNGVASNATSGLKRESGSTSSGEGGIHVSRWKLQCFRRERSRSRAGALLPAAIVRLPGFCASGSTWLTWAIAFRVAGTGWCFKATKRRDA